MRFPNALEQQFRLEHAKTFARLDVIWTLLSTSFLIAVLTQLTSQPSVPNTDIWVAVGAIVVSILPVLFIWLYNPFWSRNRGKLLGMVRLYKCMAALHLSKHFIARTEVTRFSHLLAYLLLNGRLAVLLHLSIGMRFMFHELIPLLALETAVLLSRTPETCVVYAPEQSQTVLSTCLAWFHTIFAPLVPGPALHRLAAGETDLMCMVVLAFAQVTVGMLVIPGLVLFGELRWRQRFASDHGQGFRSGWNTTPCMCVLACFAAFCTVWQLLQVWGLLYHFRSRN